MIEHEGWQKIPYKDFIDYHLFQNGHTKSPPFDESKGNVKAEVNHGRWIVNCPTEDCGGAVLVSSQIPYFICPYCANLTNKDKWFNVKFPKEKGEIEGVLEKRPKKNQNWLPNETLADLKKENAARGIK